MKSKIMKPDPEAQKRAEQAVIVAIRQLKKKLKGCFYNVTTRFVVLLVEGMDSNAVENLFLCMKPVRAEAFILRESVAANLVTINSAVAEDQKPQNNAKIHIIRHPRECGDPRHIEALDSRLRRNDGIE